MNSQEPALALKPAGFASCRWYATLGLYPGEMGRPGEFQVGPFSRLGRVTGSANFIRTVLPQDDVDPGQELAGDGTHDHAPGLPLLQATLGVGRQVRVPAAGRDRCEPECAPQIGRAPL